MEEELNNGLNVNTKLTNQMFVAAAKDDENLNSLNAATFVSVVSVIIIIIINFLTSKTNEKIPSQKLVTYNVCLGKRTIKYYFF